MKYSSFVENYYFQKEDTKEWPMYFSKIRMNETTFIEKGLVGKKMSASVEASKISLMDTPETVQKKVKSADFVAGDPNNGTMAFLEKIAFVLLQDKNEKLIIKRPEKFGGNLEFESYKELEKEVTEQSIHPLDVKNSVAAQITNLLSGIESQRKELEKLEKLAYA